MADGGAHLAGQIDTVLSPEAIVAALTAHGMRTQLRESSHFQCGSYIRIYEGDTYFTLECLSGELLARADAASLATLLATAQRVSDALARLDICHRFELYSDETTMLVRYLHHRWPE